jgi:alkanesulfonate monooxygenase SsuD/methylene tetrahydromethanopterin reductase-like flavin-dependent oxidoreductase (luciferase family)
MAAVPLSVLDLVPISSGSAAPEALRNSIDLARHAERFGYARYWFAEHHLNPGVAGTSPAVVIALTASATTTIRLGSGGVQFGHRTPLSTVEEFGLIDALYPGRIDLGIGRSGGRPPSAASEATEAVRVPVGGSAVVDGRAPNGLRIPPRFAYEGLARSPRFSLQRALLQQPGAEVPEYAEQIDELLALWRGKYRSPAGGVRVVPGEQAGVQLWILGSSGGESATVAGRHGLRFAANYHVSPGSVLEAVGGYVSAFRPSGELQRPYIGVSADVVVARSQKAAREPATGYGLWVRSIRSGEGAIEFPTPDEASAYIWSPEDRALVEDRVETQVVGTPRAVADQLEQLREATGADELVVTTITHRHADRVRSYELLAEEWRDR